MQRLSVYPKADKAQLSLTLFLHLLSSSFAGLSRKLAIVFHIGPFFLDWLRSLAPFVLLSNIKTTLKTAIILSYFF